MNVKRLLVAMNFLLVFFALPAFSQDKVVTGKVTDSKDGSALSNVTVTLKGTTVITQTNAQGIFKLKVPASATTLVITSVGYGNQEVAIGTAFLTVKLNQSSTALADVVVIGYGTARKKDLTGSIVTVSVKDFQKGDISTPEQMIAGKVPGVSIISNGGQPGGGSQIRIRGGASLTASNSPLIVIDGVPMQSIDDQISGASNPLSFINSNDIETFTVLKDGSAAAIYGTRASNGVIIITTKKGTGGGFKLNFNTTNSIGVLPKELDILSASQIRTIVNANGTAAQKAMLGSANTDWQKEIYQNSFSSNNNLSFSGGIKKLPYRVSLGFQSSNGIIKTDQLQKTSVALVMNPTFLNNHLKVDINIKGSSENTRFGSSGQVGSAIGFDPTQPVYSGSARYGGYFEWLNPGNATGLNNIAGKNPLGQLEQTFDKSTPLRSIGNIQFDYKFHGLPELRAVLNLGYDVASGIGNKFINDSAASNYLAGGGGGSYTKYKQTRNNQVMDFYFNYVKEFKNIKSKIDATVGYNFNSFYQKSYNYASWYANDTLVAGSTPVYPYDIQQNTLLSYFGRLIYTFNNKYIITATLRRDASSRFSPNNRWGTFPSITGAWKINEENFLKNSSVISDLKLRGGYSVTGQQDGLNNYDWQPFFGTSNNNSLYQFGSTYYNFYSPLSYYNRKWEQSANSNIALDFGFLKNRITGSLEFYNRKTTDLLNNVPVAGLSNFSAFVVENVGSMTNNGVEFSLNVQPIKTKDMTWDIGFNISYNQNKITKLTNNPGAGYLGFPSDGISGTSLYAHMNAVGNAKNTFYLYKQVYSTSGKPIEGVLDDLNRDGVITPSDRYFGKVSDAPVFGGFSTNFTYRKWNAGLVIRGSYGNYVFNNVNSNMGRLNSIIGGTSIGNATQSYLTTLFTGTSAVNQTAQQGSDYYLENASFLRMDNINIGYNMGQIFNKKAYLRINLSVQNVFVITKYTGLDPEVSNGVDNNIYPRPRVTALNLNLDF